MPDFSFFSDNGADSFQLLCQPGIQFNDFVDGVVHLACNTDIVDGQPRTEIAFSEIGQHAQKEAAIQLLHKGERLRLNQFFSHSSMIDTGRTMGQGVGKK